MRALEESGSWFVPTEWERLYGCHGLLLQLSRVCIVDRHLRKACDLAFEKKIARHGIPVTLVSDNGPQFSGLTFKEFVKQYGFEHITSSPYYPQANVSAEKSNWSWGGSSPCYSELQASLHMGIWTSLTHMACTNYASVQQGKWNINNFNLQKT